MSERIEFSYSLERGRFSLDIEASLAGRGITGVFGPSGAGKTTLLRCLAGLETGAKAKLTVGGEV
ncbi:MAG: ATP-binding cassette domain-containing protein, partial [Woeseiaceae bacterium]|nr:ATP-binding cassette domain-containing protein [Woeseiaceae bacterium]